MLRSLTPAERKKFRAQLLEDHPELTASQSDFIIDHATWKIYHPPINEVCWTPSKNVKIQIRRNVNIWPSPRFYKRGQILELPEAQAQRLIKSNNAILI